MSFVRPELIAALRARLTHPVEAGVVAVFGGVGVWALWSGVSPPSPVLVGLGVAALSVAGIAARAFAVRARLARGGGAGIVQVDEQRIAYFGPEGGGFVGFDALDAVDVLGQEGVWILRQGAGEDVRIPVGADGVEALFDALSALPGFSEQRAVEALERRAPHVVMVWARPGAGPSALL